MKDDELMIFDQIVIICQGCGDNKIVNFNPPIVGAAQLIEYNKTKLTPCECGHGYCDIKARIANDKDMPSMN